MNKVNQSVGDGPVPARIAQTDPERCFPPLPQRAGGMPVGDLIDVYMQRYAGRDRALLYRLAFWKARIGTKPLEAVSDDDIHAALEELAEQRGRYFAGRDADGRPILKAKKRALSGATINRYQAAIGSVFTFAIRRRIAPRHWVHPCRGVELRPESAGRVRFLSDAEREALFAACRVSTWPRLYMLTIAAVTTGARRSELLSLRWADVDLERATATLNRTKNSDPRVLPLLPVVIEEMRRFKSTPSALVFASVSRPERAFHFDSAWRVALKTAGLRAFRFHDLRHTCASYLAQRGASLYQIGEILGHRTAVMSKRYAHLATSDKASLLQRVLGEVR